MHEVTSSSLVPPTTAKEEPQEVRSLRLFILGATEMDLTPFRIAVFASGEGSNLGQLLARFPSGSAREVALVVSDRPGVRALERASAAGVPSEVVRPEEFRSPAEFGERLIEVLRLHRIDLVVLAGFMRKVPINVVTAYPNRIVNIHPALLPRFGGRGMYGTRVHAAVLAAGEMESGASVHFVDPEYDHGPVIAQARVPVLPNDTVGSLAERVLAAEHRLLPRVVELIASGKVRIAEDGAVSVKEGV